METPKVAAVVGAGPGLGAALARRFAREGYAVGLFARSESNLRQVQQEIEKAGGRAASYAADATDEASLKSAFARLREELGAPEVCIYNAGAYAMGGIQELTPEQFESSWRIGCLGGFLMAREVVPAMLERGRGTLLFTGATASLRGGARFAGFAVGKFGLRALAQSLARELGPRGIHVAHVVIDGMIDTARVRSMVPGREASTMLSPDAIAETYWQLHRQEPSAWTQEMDLRPAMEKF
ncbi:SDR family NAD(P)-dependent oxidoreductase [Vitiosangium sp. GDMCC 1.1324]|uniref:SDR family NAD(P)-dependent oxidoreductase n=1 Tax=Vitiosangium sp. (strain GDMCC 1.1324) TaxID=2138576 RepID=UPI000D3D9DF8|nr:SDR family NAD(P)-dependent oxidoreductase [Vitiosangium sp. GDMCC 1.1324]PTL84654.1 short-chain dehydrogenase [Vitiosangium sp. GDMCC 1.1324]